MRSSIGRIPDELAAKIEDLAGIKPPPPVLETVSEKDFMQAVIDVAKENGWLHYHPYDSRKSQAGFPDLVLVRDYVLWLELKTEAGESTADQLRWGEALLVAGQDYRLVRPRDFPEVKALLAAGPRSKP